MNARVLALSAVLGLSGPALAQDHSGPHAHHPQAAQQDQKQGAPLLQRLGSHQHRITTDNPLAQRYFNQGLALLYGFNHEEAIRSFREVARLDPQCAMAWWGIALAYGPNINQPMPEEAVGPAWEALQKARQLAGPASEKEQAYIRALSARYAEKPPQDRSELDLAYAQAMRQLAERYPDDVDALALYAEALMDTMPWDYWQEDGRPRPATVHVLAALEEVLRRAPDHLGGNHYYIHAVEASPSPERGLPSAHRLRQMELDAGHLVHMPAHIYLRLGMYHDASLVNEDAIRADRSYMSQCAAQGYYPKLYVPHNMHFLWHCLTIEGRSGDAMKVARETSSYINQQGACGGEAAAQGLLPLLTMVRFGQWDQVLAEPQQQDPPLFAQIMWHYARGLAHCARGEVPEAQQELAGLRRLAGSDKAATLDDDPFFPGSQVVAVAEHVLAGELAARQGQHDQAVRLLNKGVQLEDKLPYMEPPYWPSPVRLTLGAVLLEAQRPAEAEAVYRQDLRKHPENGWALYGLLSSLRAQGKADEARAVEASFQRAWIRADTALTGSRH
jgi:tetratricopeptide (TPR) repeat protein